MQNLIIDFAPKVVGAILFYIIGFWVINRLTIIIKNILSKRNYDASLQTFLVSLTKVSMTILLLVSIAGILGVDTTAFSALIVGAGVAIGSALNGTLGNFAGGIMMLVFKPFKVGDLIEAQGVTGVVIEQGVFNTTVLTPENKTVFLPNGALSTNTITNYTTHGNLRVDLQIAIANDADVENAKRVALNAINNTMHVLPTPAASVHVLEVANGMTTLALRPYTKQIHYWDVYFGCTEAVKKAFELEGIAGPIPTRIIMNK
ncbi:MAG: mechanosensitive ion channel family protein [Chitinophagaceae bacterium]|nr:mechanosensitive ion channel family protein [Chitinophagaceae bacterium]